MSTLRKWAQNTQNKLNIKNNNTNGTKEERKWIHPPGTLQKGHIAYLVKFLGNIVVDQPKEICGSPWHLYIVFANGIDVVKEAIRKLKFTQQLRKSESGAKTRKVELTISIDGVAIQEPKTHVILHQFPLHRISYCADDKGEKRFFSFIAKQTNQVNSDAEDTHECFVFISDKLAEEITLTIGQAFELAYKRFLETSGKDLESQRRAILTQQRIKRLELENNIYKQRLLFLSQLSSIKPDLDQYLRKHEIKNILEIPQTNSSVSSSENSTTTEHTNGNSVRLLDFDSGLNGNGSAPPVPPRAFDSTPSPAIGTKLEGLLLNEFEQENDNDFDPRSFEQTNGDSTPKAPLIAPPPKAPRKSNINNNIIENNLPDAWSSHFNPGSPSSNSLSSPKILDPFEMGDFGNTTTTQDIENALGLLDKRILEMKTGFSRGISFGNDDFSLESLDPLKN
ncbi:hypothetical protein HHI36_000931 [Cryptolaemus montrouzieri]|uniref:PID domain-containing protein n=1 Tax=Cryptolaemus montrouzieri TaxID=559131 RepID=A0ABD2P5Z7_9CUCU